MAKKSTKKTRKKRSVKKARGRRTNSASNLDAISDEALRAELSRRQRQSTTLLRKRDRLRAQLDAVEAELRANGASLAGLGSGRRRPSNAMTLVDAMHSVLDGKEFSVTDLALEVQRSGYNTTSPNFRTIVNQTLIKNPKLFKRVARGTYTAK
ncbi:MAG: hypothetical protein AAGB48_07680 [Planctomycetota bacterium]